MYIDPYRTDGTYINSPYSPLITWHFPVVITVFPVIIPPIQIGDDFRFTNTC